MQRQVTEVKKTHGFLNQLQRVVIILACAVGPSPAADDIVPLASSGTLAISDVSVIKTQVARYETVEITFESGLRASESVEHPRGSPERPLSDEERLRKVRSCVSLVLGAQGAETLISRIAGLEDLPDCAPLGRACTPS